MAYEEWKKGSLANHAEVYPDIWLGLWSGPDVYQSVLTQEPGSTYPYVIHYPLHNAWSHTTPLISLMHLVGVEFKVQGLILRPQLQVYYNLTSNLIGVARSPGPQYDGWYSPATTEEIQVTLYLVPAEQHLFYFVQVNGVSIQLTHLSDGGLQFRGTSSPSHPLTWKLQQ